MERPVCLGQMHNLMTKKCDCDRITEALCGTISLQASIKKKLDPPKKVRCRISSDSPPKVIE